MSDSVGLRIARKLYEGLRTDPKFTLYDTAKIAALIDAELAREPKTPIAYVCAKCWVIRWNKLQPCVCGAVETCNLQEERKRLARERDAGWVSVKERFPEKGKTVLVYFAAEPVPYFDVWHYNGANRYFRSKPSKRPHEDVTHWAELPAPPDCAS